MCDLIWGDIELTNDYWAWSSHHPPCLKPFTFKSGSPSMQSKRPSSHYKYITPLLNTRFRSLSSQRITPLLPRPEEHISVHSPFTHFLPTSNVRLSCRVSFSTSQSSRISGPSLAIHRLDAPLRQGGPPNLGRGWRTANGRVTLCTERLCTHTPGE